jgi:dTDP-4-amino-4,6-dideoxygalactose transaminase
VTDDFVKPLPFALPELGEEEISEVVDSMRSGWVSTGPKVKLFEEQFSQFLGGDVQSIACNSATAGLHLALEAFGIGPGDQVLTTPFTFTATAEVIRYLGADPVFADVNQDTYNIDPGAASVAANSCNRLRAILPVHIGGQAADMAAIGALAQRHGVSVLEDAAHALPTTHNGRMVGTISRATVFSFYATKTITTGEGGMVVSRDSALIERVRAMRLHGINRDVFDRYTSTAPKWYYEVIAPGYKYNMPDVAAAMGIHQLKKAWRFYNRRKQIAERYAAGLAGLPLKLPVVARQEDVHAWHLYIVQLNLDEIAISRDQFIELMADQGIGCSVHYIPLHLQPYWRERYNLKPEQFPVATALYRRIVSLPIYTLMTDDDVCRVIGAVREVLARHSR